MIRHRKNKELRHLSVKIESRRINQVPSVDDYLETWMEAFLIDRNAGRVASGTFSFYRIKLNLFVKYCEAQAVKNIRQIAPTLFRQYLLLYRMLVITQAENMRYFALYVCFYIGMRMR